VVGTDVYGQGDEVVGEIDHLLIEKVSGRVAYAVMSFGGFLGLAHSHYPIPWSALTYDTGLGGFRTGITEEQLRDAPEFSDDSWTDRNWETRTHQHYGASPYWGAQEQRSRGTFHADNLMAFRRAARPHTGPLALWRILGIRPNTVSVCVGTADQRANWSVVLRELRR
jgi:hypothetical protein